MPTSTRSLVLLKPYGPLDPSDRFHYVTVHPPEAADASLPQTGSVGIVDLYWAYEDNAYFVSILRDAGRPISSQFNPRAGELKGDFFVTVQTGSLSIPQIEATLSSLADWIERGNDLTRVMDGILV